MKLDVFGRLVEIARRHDQWVVFYLGNEGKKRLATDIRIPPEMPEADIVDFVDVLCHEWATVENPKVLPVVPEKQAR